MRKKYLSLLQAIAWFAITTILLSLPGSAFPEEHWFDRIWLDKWIHVGLFGVMVFLWCRVVASRIENNVRSFVQIAVYFFLYGIVMEFIQNYFIPNRSFDIGDVIADGLGCAAGLLLANRIYIKK